MTVNNTDTFLVERSGTSYKLQAQNLMADLQDNDLMLVERSGTSYKATGLDIKNSLGSDEPTFKATASGSIGNGNTVCLNSNGTVSVVTSTNVSHSVGSEINCENQSSGSAYQDNFDSCMINSTTICVVYNFNGSNVYSRIGTISGNSISFGTEVHVGSGSYECFVNYNPTVNRLLYNYGKRARCASFSGTTITLQSQLIWDSYIVDKTCAVYHESDGKVYLAYNWFFANVIRYEVVASFVFNASGNPTYENYSMFLSGSNPYYNEKRGCYDSSTGVCVFVFTYGSQVHAQLAGTNTGGTNSGIPFVSERVAIASSTSYAPAVAHDASIQKPVISWRDGANNNYFTYLNSFVPTATTHNGAQAPTKGNNITWKTNGKAINTDMTYDSQSQKVAVAYVDSAGNYRPRITPVSFSLSGTTLSASVGTAVDTDTRNGYTNTYQGFNRVLFVTGGKVIHHYNHASAAANGIYVRFVTLPDTTTNVTATNFVGFADGSYSNGQEAKIITHLGSATTSQSNLTTGNTYYVRKDGSLSVNPFSVTVKAGLATASNAIDINVIP